MLLSGLSFLAVATLSERFSRFAGIIPLPFLGPRKSYDRGFFLGCRMCRLPLQIAVALRLDCALGVFAANDFRHLLPFIAINEAEAKNMCSSPVWDH